MLVFPISFTTYRILFTSHTMSLTQWNASLNSKYVYSTMAIGTSSTKSKYHCVTYRHGTYAGFGGSDFSIFSIGK